MTRLAASPEIGRAVDRLPPAGLPAAAWTGFRAALTAASYRPRLKNRLSSTVKSSEMTIELTIGT